MKQKFLVVLAASALLLPAVASAAGYYATKADERAGRLTPGNPPVPPSSGGPLRVGTDACPGLTIADPGVGMTFNDSGTTIGANNTVTSIQAGCSEYNTVAGPDVVYTFTLGALGARGAALTITVTPSSGFDTSIYTLSTAGAGCPAGTANAATNCVNGSDSGVNNVAETISDAETDAMAAGTYFLFVDSFYASPDGGGVPHHNGPYTLAMGVGAFPVELMEFEID
jgi:hypothetical protein